MWRCRCARWENCRREPPATAPRSYWRRFGLGDHRRKTPDQLSGGQRQRVAVARALANDPPVILADEPTGSLDTFAASQVFGILRDLVALRGKTVVAVTHDLHLASQMHRRLHVVDGRLAQGRGPRNCRKCSLKHI